MTDDVLILAEGAVGRIRLNRPRSIHALTHAMCKAMTTALLQWQGDSSIKAVIIDHAAGRGFCAGGDVIMVANSGRGDGAEARAFFRDEYRLNHLLFTYSKPTVAVMDGITMGGGVGIAMPCRYRVATENTRFAMPETAIGLFPDVGGGWYLSRLPGRVGEFMALTGARMDGAECHYLGLATHYMAADTREEMVARVARAPSRIKGALGALSVTAPEPRIAANLPAINRLFAADRIEQIIAALEADESDWAAGELAAIRTKSPSSCKLSLRLLELARKRRSFAEEMRAEYALVTRVVRSHDFIEGARALLIDKDNAPRWDPPTFDQVSDEKVEAMFAPLPPDEEWTPLPTSGAEQ